MWNWITMCTLEQKLKEQERSLHYRIAPPLEEAAVNAADASPILGVPTVGIQVVWCTQVRYSCSAARGSDLAAKQRGVDPSRWETHLVFLGNPSPS